MSDDHEEGCIVCSLDGVLPREEILNAVIAHTKEIVERYGWAVQGMVDVSPSYSYSIGMSQADLPEIMMVGFNRHTCGNFINTICMMMADGHVFEDWTRSDDVLEDYPVFFREIDPVSINDKCGMLYNVCGDDRPHRMLHMIFPTKAGLFPWDAGYEPDPDYLQEGQALVYKSPPKQE